MVPSSHLLFSSDVGADLEWVSLLSQMSLGTVSKTHPEVWPPQGHILKDIPEVW